MMNEAYLATWKTYQAAWADIGVAQRRKLLTESVAEDCIDSDPIAACRGIDALNAKIEDSKQKFPGASFRNDTFLDYHDHGLSHWTMLNKEGAKMVEGASYARFGADGKLTQMTGFFEAK